MFSFIKNLFASKPEPRKVSLPMVRQIVDGLYLPEEVVEKLKLEHGFLPSLTFRPSEWNGAFSWKVKEIGVALSLVSEKLDPRTGYPYPKSYWFGKITRSGGVYRPPFSDTYLKKYVGDDATEGELAQARVGFELLHRWLLEQFRVATETHEGDGWQG